MQRGKDGRFALWAAIAAWATAAACTVESPASTPPAPAPANLFQHSSLELAWQAAVAGKRPLVVMFTSDQCPHCERMLKETYGHPAIRQFLLTHAETALVHVADYRELAAKLGLRGYPTSLVVSAEGQILDAIEGYADVPTFARRVQRWIGPHAAVAAPRTARDAVANG